MAALIRKSVVYYNFLFDELSDPRTKSWPLVAKPFQVMAIVVLYLMFVKKWGPKWMINKQPLNIERILIGYNAIQVVICGYIFYHGLHLWKNYKYLCQPVDYSNSESAITMATLIYYYFLLKILDLLDTVFFVFRKKFSHISFLHVYHHAGMVGLSWGAVTYLPGGHGSMVGLVNTFVHVVMYSYYLLTVAYPSLKGSMWWKKYITQLQIFQFLHNVVHVGSLAFIPSCGYPRWTAILFLPQNIFMLILFLDFYIKEYIKKPKLMAKKNGELNAQEKETTRRFIEPRQNLTLRS